MLGYQEIRATYVTRLPGCNHVNYLIGMLKSWYISSFFEIYHLRAYWTLFIEKLCWFKAASVRTLFHRWSRQTGLRTFEDFKISKICINSAVSCNRVLLCFLSNLSVFLPPTTEEVYVFVRTPEFVCLSVCLCARLLKNTCMDLDEMLRVDRCRDMDELINFWARSGS